MSSFSFKRFRQSVARRLGHVYYGNNSSAETCLPSVIISKPDKMESPSIRTPSISRGSGCDCHSGAAIETEEASGTGSIVCAARSTHSSRSHKSRSHKAASIPKSQLTPPVSDLFDSSHSENSICSENHSETKFHSQQTCKTCKSLNTSRSKLKKKTSILKSIKKKLTLKFKGKGKPVRMIDDESISDSERASHAGQRQICVIEKEKNSNSSALVDYLNSIHGHVEHCIRDVDSHRIDITQASQLNEAPIPTETQSMEVYESMSYLPSSAAVALGDDSSSFKEYSLATELFKLSKCGWYWGPISRLEAEDKLSNQIDGAFLVRDSSDDRYLLSLSFRSFGKTLHTRIEHCNGLFSFYAQEYDGHRSIVELIEKSMGYSASGVFCYSRARFPGAPSFPVRLTKPISRFTQVRSLQYLCRFVIRQYTRLDHIQHLPLPPRIKGYIEEGHY